MQFSVPFFKAVGLSLLLPIICFVSAQAVVADIDHKQLLALAACNSTWPPLPTEVVSTCGKRDAAVLLGTASIVSGIVPLVLMWLQSVGSTFAGTSRFRMALVFPALTNLTILFLALILLVQGALLFAAVALLEQHFLHRMHWYFLAIILGATLYAAFQLVRAASRMLARPIQTVMGKALKAKDAPRLFDYVNALAKRLKAKPPSTIILGLDPTFYVTGAPMRVGHNKKVIKGEKLFLSLPLSRIFTCDELTAVIGHELGHFRGKDTVYSQRFAPVYMGLESALNNIGRQSDDGITYRVLTMPARNMLYVLYEAFAKNAATVSREREFEADRAGAEAASPKAIATSLLKAGLYDGLWHDSIQGTAHAYQRGYLWNNMSRLFQDNATRGLHAAEPTKLDNIMADLLKGHTPHPIDSHPPTDARIAKIGVDAATLTRDVLLPAPDGGATVLIDDVERHEEDLTDLQIRLFFDWGVATLLDGDKAAEILEERTARAAVLIASRILTANGAADPAVAQTVEAHGKDAFPKFDSDDFAHYLAHPAKLPANARLLEFLHMILSPLEARKVQTFAVDTAKLTLSPAATKLLSDIEAAWFPR